MNLAPYQKFGKGRSYLDRFESFEEMDENHFEKAVDTEFQKGKWSNVVFIPDR